MKIYFYLFLLCLGPWMTYAQVGIGNTNPNPNALLEIGDGTDSGGIILPRVALSSLISFSPLTSHIEGMIVYNTSDTGDVSPGFYYNDGACWCRINADVDDDDDDDDDDIDSVTLGTDQLISGSTFADIPAMSVSFTARKSNVMVMLTGSGLGYTSSISNLHFQVYNNTSSTIVGGTNTKVQNITIISYGRNSPTIDAIYSTTTWSTSFSKMLTGLSIGTTYTLKVQGKTTNIYGTDGAAIYPVTYPEDNHLTLSIIQ